MLGRVRRLGCVGLLALTAMIGAGARFAWADTGYDFRPARVDHGQLQYVNHVPVLTVAGTPEEMGRAAGELLQQPTRELLVFPQVMLQLVGKFAGWARFVELAHRMERQFPPAHLREFDAFVQAARIDRELALVANTMTDTYRGGLGCSSLLVESSRCAAGGPLFGRNLDFFGGGLLDRYSLVIVYRPQGKHAFAAVGFPGLVGCLSGMNDAGLALAVHEVRAGRDGALLYNPQGTPYTLLFRRILEECTDVDAAEKLLRAAPRSTQLNLAVCDRRHAAVLELTPRTVVRRNPSDGLLACTNHFRSPQLSIGKQCWRYDELMQAAGVRKLDVAAVAGRLQAAAAERLTLQSMIFEPRSLALHVSFGPPPATRQPLRKLELAPLLGVAAAPPPDLPAAPPPLEASPAQSSQ